MLFFVKYVVYKFLWICFHVLWIFPVRKGTVMFECSGGRSGMICNPLYIYIYMKKVNNPNYKYIWVVNDIKAFKDKKDLNTIFVKTCSLKYFYWLIVCDVFISNAGTRGCIPYRKNQLRIDTWHGGGAYKKSCADDYESQPLSPFYKKLIIIGSNNTTYFISSCKKFIECMSTGKFYTEDKALKIGMPRNDIFFNKEESESANSKVRKTYSIGQDDLILIFAPTYRGLDPYQVGRYEVKLDLNAVKVSLEKRFGKNVVFLFRGHYGTNMVVLEDESRSKVINATDYPDMQELLCAADVFITDYSSCMWDFALTGKPGFLYTPDIAEYENDRGVYTPISTWPFEHAETTKALCALIEEYNEDAGRARIKSHLEALGSYEDGHASEKVCALIAEHCKI